MNPESPTPREQLEARLTALLLGELSADEAAALREIMRNDAQLSALHERLKQTIALLRETAMDPAELAAEPPAPLRLGAERREKLLAQFKTVAPREFAPERQQWRPWRLKLSAAAAIVLVAHGLLILTVFFLASREGMLGTQLKKLTVAMVKEPTMAESQDRLAPTDRPRPLSVQPKEELAKLELPKYSPPPPANLANKQFNIVLPSTVGTAGAEAGPTVQNGVILPSMQLAEKEQPPLNSPASENVSTGTSPPPATGGGGTVTFANSYTAPPPVAAGGSTPSLQYNIQSKPNSRQPTGGRGGGVGGGIGGFAGGGGVTADNGVLAARAQTVNQNMLSAGFQRPDTTVAAASSNPTSTGNFVLSDVPSGNGTIGGFHTYLGSEEAVETKRSDNASEKIPIQYANPSVITNLADQLFWRSAQTEQPTVTAENGLSVSAHSINLQNADPQQVLQMLHELYPADTNKGFGSGTQQNVLQYKTQSTELGTVTPSYDPETHSIIWMSDGRTAESISNLVEELDKQQKTKQMLASATTTVTQNSFALSATNAVVTEDRMIRQSVASSVQVQAHVPSPDEVADRAPKLAAPPLEPQPEILVNENAFSTFSLNVSDVSFKLAETSLARGLMPDAGGVRTEEFINAFDYRDPDPAPGVAIGFAWERAHYPFAHNRDLLRFSVKTAAAGRQPGRPLNLVLLLDNSGSMERADRVAIIKEALKVLAAQLQPQDTVSVVTFARTARLWVDGIRGDQAGQVLETVSGLTPEGGTNLGDALELAYATARRHYLANGVNRVVLLTDGAANLGNVDPAALKQKVEAQRKQGVALDCFGIGWEGYNDDLLEVLTRNGDGRYGFINTPEEAAQGFAAQLAGALHVAASDVKVQVEFNPARVVSYRQLGYAKHQLTKEQFRDNTVNAAQIGAAEAGNALYTVEINPQGSGPVCTVRVRYRDPGTADYHEHAWDVPYTGNAVALDQASPAMKLAATASAFSEWLGQSPFAGEVTPDALLGYLRGVPQVYGADTRPAQLETMIREAKSATGK